MNMITVHAGCFYWSAVGGVYNQQPWATGHYNLFNIISINISAAVWRRQCRGVEEDLVTGHHRIHYTYTPHVHTHNFRYKLIKRLDVFVYLNLLWSYIGHTLLQNGWRFELSITDKKEVAYIIVVIRCKEEKERRRGRGRRTATVEVCTQSQLNLSTSS